MDWFNAGVAAVVFVLTVFAGVGGWVFRRELQRNDELHVQLWTKTQSLENAMAEHAKSSAVDALREEIDARYSALDRDIKNTGEKLQQVLRQEISTLIERMDKQNQRLDQIILHFSNSNGHRG